MDEHTQKGIDKVVARVRKDAGVGQTVLMIDEGNSARQVIDDPIAPVRSVIIGIVDSIDLA